MNWRVHAAIVIVFAIVACRAPATEPRPAPPSPTLPPMSVLTPDTAEVRDRLDPLIGRIVLTTAIGQDESPQNEVTTVPSDVRQLYLAVRVSDLPAGARLSAVWLRGTSQIERTERDVAEALSGARWIALGLGAERGLAAGEYVVRLYLDDRFIDSLVFTVGRGQQSTETEASLVFATEPPSDSGVIEALTVFPVGTTRVVAILTDVPSDTGGSLWSRWSVDGRVLTELGADEVRSAFVRTFTWQRTDPLSPGDYTVKVFLDQRLLAEGQFSVAGATPTPELARAT
ncbi:MAG: hypothetical protein NZL87_07500, partial [Thermomicrobium sp.]|nr:hypothetical protein [Thermomicrobium sp.]